MIPTTPDFLNPTNPKNNLMNLAPTSPVVVIKLAIKPCVIGENSAIGAEECIRQKPKNPDYLGPKNNELRPGTNGLISLFPASPGVEYPDTNGLIYPDTDNLVDWNIGAKPH